MLAFILSVEDNDKRDKLEELYITYHKELFYVAYKILNDYHDAEDIIQNAFIKMSKHLDKISEIKCKKTRAYMVIIVKNLSLDRYKAKKRTVLTDFNEDADEYPEEDISLEEHVLHLELGAELARALGSINPGYADILTLKYYYEYSNTEISELINLPVNIVSVRLTRAKAALKKILSRKEGVG